MRYVNVRCEVIVICNVTDDAIVIFNLEHCFGTMLQLHEVKKLDLSLLIKFCTDH